MTTTFSEEALRPAVAAAFEQIAERKIEVTFEAGHQKLQAMLSEPGGQPLRWFTQVVYPFGRAGVWVGMRESERTEFSAFAATANTSLQVAAPDYLRGRVMSLFFLLIAGSTPIGGFLTGFLAEQAGTQNTVGVLAALCGVGMAIGAIYYATHRDEVERTAEASPAAVAG